MFRLEWLPQGRVGAKQSSIKLWRYAYVMMVKLGHKDVLQGRGRTEKPNSAPFTMELHNNTRNNHKTIPKVALPLQTHTPVVPRHVIHTHHNTFPPSSRDPSLTPTKHNEALTRTFWKQTDKKNKPSFGVSAALT